MAQPIRTDAAALLGPRPNVSLTRLSPYKQGASGAAGAVEPIKLSSNESSFGPSPKAVEAYHGAADRLFRYPDGAQTALRHAIADRFNLCADRILCGNGSEELQLLLIRAFVSPGDEVVASEHCFSMARIHAIAQGASIKDASEPDLRPSAKSILAQITPRTRLIMLASPNNPVGDYIRADELSHLVEHTPPEIVILYDGAYADYVMQNDYDSGFGLVETHNNVVVTRTFSKLYGLAGLRIGWMYAPEGLLEPVQRIRTPFNANLAALAAAEAAIRDVEYADAVRERTTRELASLTRELSALGLEVLPSYANFYLVRFPCRDGLTEDAAAAFMEARGVIPRPVGAGGPEGCLRITIGRPHENEAVISALKAFVAGGEPAIGGT